VSSYHDPLGIIETTEKSFVLGSRLLGMLCRYIDRTNAEQWQKEAVDRQAMAQEQPKVNKIDPPEPPDALSIGAGLKPKLPDGPWAEAKMFPTFERHFEHKPRFEIEEPKQGISL
jgi:hypothetical protein